VTLYESDADQIALAPPDRNRTPFSAHRFPEFKSVGNANGSRHFQLRASFRDVADRAVDDDRTIGIDNPP